MRGLFDLLACLMLVLAGWSGMAHAADLAGGNIGGFEFAVHASGDGDEVPADADKGFPHHHNACHGHDVGEPSQPVLAIGRILHDPDHAVGPVASLTGTIDRVTPRPPQA